MKDKFQSLVGMRGACGWLNDPLITHLSPTNHPLKHYVWKVLTMVVFLFTFGISQMWGVDYLLINGNDNSSTATLNTDDFWTAQSLQAKSNGGSDYKKCIILGGNISAGVTNINYPSRYISYGVKTTNVTITIKAYQSNNSAKKINIYEVNEAANGALTVTNTKEESVSKGLQTITFTATPAAGTRSTIYITSQAASNFEFYQVIASETGSALTNLVGGRDDYSIDYSKKSRLATKSGETAKLDGVEYNKLSADYKPNNSTVVALKTGNYIKFNTIEPIVLTIVTTSAQKFYVAQTADGTTNEKAAAATHKIKLTPAGDWYIVGGSSSATNVSSISFSVPSISYDANGGEGTMSSNTWTVAANGFTAPSGKKFDGWKDDDDNVYTVGQEVLEDVTLYAQWKDDAPEYTVTYKDGEQTLKSVNVAVGSAPAAYSPTKDCYTFAAWQKDAVDYDPADLATDAAANASITLTARWTPVYSSSATLISDDVVSDKPNVNTVFAASNIVSSITFAAGNYEFASNETKPGYYGYKDKASGDYMKILVKQGKRAQVLFGNLGADPTITVNGVAKSLDAARATGDMAENTFTWTAAEDALIVIIMGSGTNTLKKVDIVQLYTATRVDGKSDGAGTVPNVLETTLPTPATVSGWTFTGWTANEDVKAGEDTKTAGTVLAAGTYTLLANTTFTAQWAEASSTYDITYVSAHGTAPDAENAASVVLAELSADGWAHKGWTASADVTVDAATVEAGTLIANGKTAILASNVTFTAVWNEIFTVTFDSKGGSAVDPIDVEYGASIAAAPADPTKDDYVFQGWSETDGGAVVADITALTITEDKTLYAKWKLDVQVNEIVFSNGFKGWIVGSTVTVFYMAGESAPTIASYAGKNLKAEGGVVISGDKIIATATDDSELEFDLTMTEVTPLATTGAQTFDGSEGYVKTRHAWTAERKWKLSKYGTDGRVARGETSLYIFLGAAESVTLDWGAQKVTDDVAVYVNGTFVKNVGKNNNSAIELSNGNNMVALYSLQTSGDIWLNGLTVAPWVPVTAVTLKEGEDPISSKEIWESTSFTLTAEVTPDNASNKTITWTSSDPTVATVADGVVTGVAANASPVTITASTVDGVTATCEVTVTAAPEPSAAPDITTQPADANYYEEATIAALEVVATGESLSYQWYLGADAISGAESATYTPTVSAIGSYVYHCVVTNTEAGKLPTSLASDNATITIAEDPAAIKLLDGSTVNHTNFITGVTADETVEFQGNTVNYAKFSGTVSGVNGVKDLTRVIAYNATTNKTKIRIYAHNNSTSGRNILVKGLVEGADAATDLATIALGNKEDKISDWIEFNNAANRTIYIFVPSSAGDVYFTQVKVIESGENAMKQAGEAGYAFNLNKGRFFGLASTDLAFEGLNARLSGDYTALNSGYAKLNATSMSFTVASDMLLTVTANNNKTYYVTKDAAGTDNETAKTGASEFNLTAGTWFITAGTAEVQLTNIAFALPKCAEPTITPMSNSDLCEGDDFAPLTVSASVSDEGTLHYQWYKEAGADDEAVGTDAASYTPEADGQYYVIVTNRKDGFSDNSATSNTITVAHFAAAVITTAPQNQRGEVGDVVTLSVLATGKNVSYKWYTCDEDGGNEVALDPEQTEASLDITITAGLAQWYKVIVTSDCGNAEAKAKVSEFQPTTPANVTNSILWDWTSSAWPASGTAAFTNEASEDYELLADADAIVPNVEGFRSDMLYGKGQYVWRSSNKFFQGTHIKFTSTVAGKVRVNFRSTGSGKTVAVAINGIEAGSRSNSFGWSEYVVVEAGEVEILCSGDGYTRIQQIEFLALAHQRTSGYAAGDLGTVCLEDATIIDGANLYELQGLDEHGYLAFDQITTGELEAGKPYLFEVTNPSKVSFYKPVGAAHRDTEIETNGMIGTFSGTTLTQGANNYYYFSGRHIWRVNDFTVSIPVPAYRCYVDMDELQPVAAPLPMPGRKRVAIGVNGAPQVTTGIDNAGAISAPRKMMINGKLFILRGEKMFDATGRLVK